MMRQTSRSAPAPRAQTGSRRCGRRSGLLLRMRGARRPAATAALAMVAAMLWSSTASAQLDPLLFVKRVPPTVIIVVDTSLRMLDDGSGNVYDPFFYSTTDDPDVMPAFPNIDPASSKTYRRIFKNFQYDAAISGRYTADSISAVPAVWDPADALTSNSPADEAFLDPTRYAITKSAIDAAVSENASSSFRWGLVKLRQRAPQWRTSGNCEKPVTVSDTTQDDYGDTKPCDASGLLTKNYATYVPSVAAPNYSLNAAPAGTVMVAPGDNTSASVLTAVRRKVGDNLGLVPASYGDSLNEDRPLSYALADAKAAAIAAIAADSAANRVCRNTVVVLITSGANAGDAGYMATNDAVNMAKSFKSVSASGVDRRIPIHVIGVKTSPADENELKSIASESGGRFTNATDVAEVTASINLAVQHGFARWDDFNAGKGSEFIGVSPIVGTVNLEGAANASGAPLPYTDIQAVPGGQQLPQRSNMMITAGFELPGFDGRIRALRTYVPESDPTSPIGWKFVKDGTRLWPDLDGRPDLAGQARVPADSSNRNIYTFVPSGAGGGSIAWIDSLGLLRVGPHSAGAEPGPACYNRGGRDPTVTDADLLLGYVPADFFLGGEITLAREKAVEAVKKIAAPLGLSDTEAAQAIYTTVNSFMADQITEVSIKRGYDVRDFALVAGGGAGPVHAAAMAELLSIPAVLIPSVAATYSAFGMFAMDVGRNYSRSYICAAKNIDIEKVNRLYREMEAEALAGFEASGVSPERVVFRRSAEMRYGGQFHEVEIDLPNAIFTTARLETAVQAFHRRHEMLYTFQMPWKSVEFLTFRLRATVPRAPFHLRGVEGGADGSNALKRRRSCWFKGRQIDTPVYEGARLTAGASVRGPAIIEETTTTVVIPPAFVCAVDRWKNYVLTRASSDER